MANGKVSTLLSLVGVILLWPFALTKSISSKLQTAHSASMSAEQEQERPHVVVKRSTQNCDSSFDNYCMNGGQCMLLVDANEHHCKCHSGFYGPRCSNLELVVKPMGEKQIVFTVFCVTMLLVALAGALYLCFKWYKKNKCNPRQKRQGYKGVQTM
ncbi:proepiregulin-like [Dunckerocampus dactyliophorus]|uniref:proepiregulin-like n=1 Tax=Dunckerocampus dactyliophorus TaxID=161453 RepID=UPI002405A81A|nr:proepiregulin-like [Dunckerocampus dactyliophorus]